MRELKHKTTNHSDKIGSKPVNNVDERHDEILRQSLEILELSGRDLSADDIEVLKTFMGIQGHITVSELKEIMDEKDVNLSSERIRELLLIAGSLGMAREQRFDDHEPRFEHLHPDEHHDHMICVKCRKIEEFEDPEIDRMLNSTVHHRGFSPIRHRMEIYGICGDCQDQSDKEISLNMADPDSRVEIVRLSGGQQFQQRLKEMGLIDGEEITVLKSGDEGPCVIAVGDSRMGIGAGMAKKIVVRMKR